MKQIQANMPRYILIGAIAVVVFSLLNAWVAFSKRYDQAVDASLNPTLQAPVIGDTYLPEADKLIAADDGSLSNDPNTTSINTESLNTATNAQPNNGRLIRVDTDQFLVSIDPRGGDIVEVALKSHRAAIDSEQPFVLLERNRQRTYIAQSGLVGPNGTDSASGRAVFLSQSNQYTLREGQQSLDVDLVFNDPDGIQLTKRYTFSHDSHLIQVKYLVSNQSNDDWNATFYAQIKRDNSEAPGADGNGFGMSPFLGAATTDSDKPYRKFDFDDIAKEPYRESSVATWIAMVQHYFISAWIPNAEENVNVFTKKTNDNMNIIGFTANSLSVPSGSSGEINASFYAGPKDQYALQKIANHLDLTVDYGWLWWIAQPLYTLLHFFATGDFHAFGKIFSLGEGVKNWGIAIILLTLVIKIGFFRLSATSYRSMANMRRVAPKMAAIREQHGNDRQQQSKAMMELYQKEKINPFGGCLPMLIQMPVFIALYWVLMESVELRHAPFMLWIKDLSVMDPFFVLPVLMGATMWFQQKLNPSPLDPMQAKVMQWMPIMFTFFFLWFPAGLVLYWVVNNILSIAQQWIITKNIEASNG